MYCCCEKIRPNLGHVDVELSDIEQNTKNNDICSTNKKKNININININNNIIIFISQILVEEYKQV
jgi:hypothetical protein